MNTARALKRFFTTYCISLFSLTVLTAVISAAVLPYFKYQSDTICGCQQFDSIPNTPASWLLFGVLCVCVFGLLIVIGRIIKMLWQTRRFHRSLMQQIVHTTVYQGIPIHIIDLPTPKAVCVGYVRPHVYVSTTVLHELSGFELLAVIQHEVEHAKRFDPLQRLVLQALPVAILRKYISAQEIIADDAVTDTPAIHSAFVKLTESMQSPAGSFAATWFSTNQARVNHWLGEPILMPSFRFGIIGFAIIGIILVMSYRAFAAEPTTQAFGQCLAEQTMCESVMSYVVQ